MDAGVRSSRSRGTRPPSGDHLAGRRKKVQDLFVDEGVEAGAHSCRSSCMVKRSPPCRVSPQAQALEDRLEMAKDAVGRPDEEEPLQADPRARAEISRNTRANRQGRALKGRPSWPTHARADDPREIDSAANRAMGRRFLRCRGFEGPRREHRRSRRPRRRGHHRPWPDASRLMRSLKARGRRRWKSRC